MGIAIVGSGKWTYSQSFIPANPNIGETWQEINSDGLVLGQWYWNGTYWLSLQTFAIQGYAESGSISASSWVVSGGSSAVNTVMADHTIRNIFLETVGVRVRSANGTVSTGDWTFQFGRFASLFADTPTINYTRANVWVFGASDIVDNTIPYNKFFAKNQLHRLECYATKIAGSATLNILAFGLCRIAR